MEGGGQLAGIVMQESLLDKGVLDRLQIVGTETVDAGEPVADQPHRWTLLHFEAAAQEAGALAEALQTALAAGPWYVDFVVGDEHIVVFSDAVFGYLRRDAGEAQRARDHGRTHGLPESQLDWQD